MLKQQDQYQDGFVSFMLEKEDSFILNSSDNSLKLTNDDDYYKQLSRQFYGQKNQEIKKTSKIDPTFKQFKIIFRAFITNTEKQKPAFSVPTVSQQLQQQIQKLLSLSKPKLYTCRESTQRTNIHSTQKINQIKNFYMQQQPAKFNIPIPTKKNNVHEPRTYRLRIKESTDQFNQITQNSYRSTLNSSTKSIAKLDKNIDNCYPIKQQKQKDEDNASNLFKIFILNKY